MAHYKGQGKSRAHFYSEYLVNGDNPGKLYYFHHVESHALAFDFYIYIWSCLIQKVMVKVMQIIITSIS